MGGGNATHPPADGRALPVNWKIELIFVPVADVDRAKDFYERIGFNADQTRPRPRVFASCR